MFGPSKAAACEQERKSPFRPSRVGHLQCGGTPRRVSDHACFDSGSLEQLSDDGGLRPGEIQSRRTGLRRWWADNGSVDESIDRRPDSTRRSRGHRVRVDEYAFEPMERVREVVCYAGRADRKEDVAAIGKSRGASHVIESALSSAPARLGASTLERAQDLVACSHKRAADRGSHRSRVSDSNDGALLPSGRPTLEEFRSVHRLIPKF